MTALNQNDFTRFAPVATAISQNAPGPLCESDEFRLFEALLDGGPQTALSLGRQTRLAVVDVWEWAARKTAARKLVFNPQTQYFSLPGTIRR